MAAAPCVPIAATPNPGGGTKTDVLRFNIVYGGRNHIRDYVTSVLEEATAPGVPRPVVLQGRLKAISKAISVTEVVRRAAEERGLVMGRSVAVHGLREQGPDRRDRPEIEIVLVFRNAAGLDRAVAAEEAMAAAVAAAKAHPSIHLAAIRRPMRSANTSTQHSDAGDE
eukprot:TRINITY_DN49106_c0_g1_i1.p1 TRINITY_DN49106_c0_g1~~TRINITY_DN49106_c0_g1_i1.p1  ORF type:complete len:168 (+),score=21.56 TRINITY_DN49106_c0_g1_i1:62-565(+)